MNILIVGSGGREHALAWKLSASSGAKVHVAPGNAGLNSVATRHEISADDFEAILKLSRQIAADLIVVGPEKPLVEGLADKLSAAGFKVFGPGKEAAILEGSKIFAKKFCDRHDIPTARWMIASTKKEALECAKKIGLPCVVKADSLASGKGVFICKDESEVKKAAGLIFEEKIFGGDAPQAIVEEFLSGEEVSFMAICDGSTALALESCRDHKRALDDDRGPNTGGMGAYSPSEIMTDQLKKKIMDKIIRPTIEGMKKEGRPFTGVLYAGLMISKDELKLLEFNARFGDPETQALLVRMKTDLASVLLAAAAGNLSNAKIEWHDNASVCVVMASGGYPSSYDVGHEIAGLDEARATSAMIFHAGTKFDPVGRFITNGGRVFGVTATGKSLSEARLKAYEAAQRITWKNCFFRTDIAEKKVKKAAEEKT